jgi:hypothetical protein
VISINNNLQLKNLTNDCQTNNCTAYLTHSKILVVLAFLFLHLSRSKNFICFVGKYRKKLIQRFEK